MASCPFTHSSTLPPVITGLMPGSLAGDNPVLRRDPGKKRATHRIGASEFTQRSTHSIDNQRLFGRAHGARLAFE
jgi:hypothetical protein